jgi:lysophospholipase L1-like esterase
MQKIGNKTVPIVIIALIISLSMFLGKGDLSNVASAKVYPSNARAIRAVVLGDSIAKSTGASNPKAKWQAILTQLIHKRHPEITLSWDIEAKDGTTVYYALSSFSNLIFKPDIVFVCVGRNDCYKLKIDEFNTEYKQLIETINATTPKPIVVLIVEPQSNIDDDSKFIPFRDSVLNLAKEHDLLVVDQWNAFPHDSIALSKLLTDKTHPNDDGYILFAETIMSVIDSSLLELPDNVDSGSSIPLCLN